MSTQSSPPLVAVAHQARGDGVAVGLVANQHVPEMLAGRWQERLEERAQLSLIVRHESDAKPVAEP